LLLKLRWRDAKLSEPATPAALAQPTDRVYYIERFYSLVAGASEDRIGLTLREDLQRDALNAAYTIEAWLEEVQGREEKYDRLATLARSISPISDLLRTLAKGAYNDFFAQLISSYEEKHIQSILAQREELRQSAGEADEGDLPAHDDDPLTALLAVVATPDGRDDYVAWFQIGWLYWKRGVLDEAENAFRTGASFSQRQSTWYFAQSLRHEAYMQWKRGNFERSRSTVRRAIEIRRDPALLVEAARYSMACGQQLESQSLLDEALHSDPFVFVSVLADTAFSSAVTSTVDILVRQQTRATEAAKNERVLWSDTIDLIKLAEKLGDIPLLPESADSEFQESALDGEIDFPTAIFRFDQAKTSREAWASRALETLQQDTEAKSKELELAETSYRAADDYHKAKIDKIDSEQRIEELLIQDEHDQAPMPSIPQLKAEIMNGLLVGLAIFVVGLVILAGLSQLIFKSIPPLVPISPLAIVLVSPLVAVMVVFGLFGFITLPLLRIRKATILFNEAAQYAEFEADTKLKKVANESANQRESIKREWAVQKSQLEEIVDIAQKRLRAAVSAQTTLKRINSLQK
jgi:tetratricopeptide (TPR) repeat protein